MSQHTVPEDTAPDQDAPDYGAGPDFVAVRARRARLREATATVAQALVAPDEGRRVEWVLTVKGAVRTLDEAWRAHTLATEDRDGVLAQLETDAPRIAPGVDRLRHEHRQVTALLREAQRRLAAPASDADTASHPVRAVLDDVLAVIAAHRKEGRDLLHEAYAVDLGGE